MSMQKDFRLPLISFSMRLKNMLAQHQLRLKAKSGFFKTVPARNLCDILFSVIFSGKPRTRTVRGKIPTRVVLGVPIAVVSLKEISSVVVKLIETSGKKSFFYVDAHHFDIANRDPAYKRILQKATFVHAAGVGPVLASRILGLPLPERIPTPDFIGEVFARAIEKKWSFYLLGGEEGIAERAAENLRKKFPKLKIVGSHHGYFNNDKAIVEKINQASPNIILVGMGAPRQETWIVDNIERVDASTFWAVGALFDVLSGKRKIAPKWVQSLGLEWAFRLMQEPRRLWKRYLFGNSRFLLTVFQEKEFFSRKSSR